MDLIFRRALGATKYFWRQASRLAIRLSSRTNISRHQGRDPFISDRIA